MQCSNEKNFPEKIQADDEDTSNDEDEESDFVFIDLGEIFKGGTEGDLGDDALRFENHIHLPRSLYEMHLPLPEIGGHYGCEKY